MVESQTDRQIKIYIIKTGHLTISVMIWKLWTKIKDNISLRKSLKIAQMCLGSYPNSCTDTHKGL